MLGTPFMDWQQQVADVALEYDDATGQLFYREIVVTVMRQCGKSTLVLANLVDRGVSWSEPQRMVYTAQTAQEARRKLLRDWVPILERSPLAKAMTSVRQQSGSESIRLMNGSSIDVIPRDGSAGHGRTLDVGIIDEAFDDIDDRGEQAIGPGMITRPLAQKWILSTMGTDLSFYLNGKVDMGRARAADGATSGLAYFEWAIPENEDVYDPEVWSRYNPAVGQTVSTAALKQEAESVSESEFRRAYGNQRTRGRDDGPFPPEVWKAVCSDAAAPTGDLRYGLDVMPDRAHGSIAVVGGSTGELLESRGGVSWMVDRMVDIVHQNRGIVVVDGGGPAAYIADELELRSVDVERLSPADVAAACARIYDAVADHAIQVRASGPLTDAVKHVRTRPAGDRFTWSRSSSDGDVTPFFALTLAFHPSKTLKREPMIRTGTQW